MGKKRLAKMVDASDESLLTKDSTSFLDEVKRALSVPNVKRAFSLGTELFGAAKPFLDKPTWWSAAQSAFSMGKVLVEDVEVWADDYFSGDEWVEPYNADFNQAILDVLQHFPYERIKTSEDNAFVRVCTLPNGARCGWTYSGALHMVDHIYVEASRLEEIREFIKHTLWSQYRGKNLVMRKNTRLVLNGNEARVIFEVDDDFETKVSRRADRLAEQLKKPVEMGIARSIMFYGPPGTGKSTLARTVVELMGLKSFRIRIADLGGLDNSTLFEAINIFQPDAIILDDFDRAHAQAQLLETLEFFQQKVKLVMTTVNNRRALDDALLRPQRIDILELVDRMEEEVVKHVLGEYADGFELVKDWPISFIEEYAKRRSYQSTEEAASSLKELAARVNELTNYKDDKNEDMPRMMRLLRKAAKRAATDDEDVDVIEEMFKDPELPEGKEGSVPDDSPLEEFEELP